MAAKQELTWRLSDPGMDVLERAGLAGLLMALEAADEQGHDVSPLSWELSSDAVTVRWSGDARPVFEKVISWAWQVTKEGVIYLPGIHDESERSNFHLRVPSHEGIMRTFLQHTNVQPKGEREYRAVKIDEGREISVSYQPPIIRDSKTKDGATRLKAADRTKLLKPAKDIADLFDRKGAFRAGTVELSNWLYPGIAGRFSGEGAWKGPPERAFILMFVPTVCLYQRLQGQGGNWVFVVPDVRELEDFPSARRRMTLNADFVDVASIGDAGLQFFAEYTSHKPRRSLAGCRVVAMGKVRYYASQSIRKAVLDVTADVRQIDRYRLLHQQFPNVYIPLRTEGEDAGAKPGRKPVQKAKKTAGREPPKAAGFFKLPVIRGRIADNLVNDRPWYEDLFVPQAWDLEDLERQRARNPGMSIHRILFEAVRRKGRALMKLIDAEAMWDTEAEKVFVQSFWETMESLYAQEAEATERGGSRTKADRFADLNEDIRRKLTQAKTRTLLRSVLTGLFARAGRQKTLRTYPAAVWRMIDSPDQWRKGRDLALLALASYQKKEVREASTTTKGD